MKHDKDLLEVLAQVYGTLSENIEQAQRVTPPTVFVLETDTVYVDDIPKRVYLLKQEPLLCGVVGNAPIYRYEEEEPF